MTAADSRGWDEKVLASHAVLVEVLTILGSEIDMSAIT